MDELHDPNYGYLYEYQEGTPVEGDWVDPNEPYERDYDYAYEYKRRMRAAGIRTDRWYKFERPRSGFAVSLCSIGLGSVFVPVLSGVGG